MTREELEIAFDEGVRFAAELLGGIVIPGQEAREACIARIRALAAAQPSPAQEEPKQWECVDCGEQFVERPIGHNHFMHDAHSASIRCGTIVRLAQPSPTGDRKE